MGSKYSLFFIILRDKESRERSMSHHIPTLKYSLDKEIFYRVIESLMLGKSPKFIDFNP